MTERAVLNMGARMLWNTAFSLIYFGVGSHRSFFERSGHYFYFDIISNLQKKFQNSTRNSLIFWIYPLFMSWPILSLVSLSIYKYVRYIFSSYTRIHITFPRTIWEYIMQI